MSEAESGERFDVFLCHNSSDKPTVRALGERLREHGLAVWLDVWELRPGMAWIRGLEKGIQASKTAAVIVGNDGLGPWQREEMEGLLIKAVKRGIPVVPVILPGVTKPELPVFLETRIWVDLAERDGFERLLWAITGVKPSASPPPPSYPDEHTRERSEALKATRQHRKELARQEQDTSEVDKKILDLRRELRKGGLKPGDHLSERFELLEPIGQGGYGRVWRAWDEKLEKVVALKVLHLQYAEDKTRRERFFRGARKMAQLQHQGIVRVIEPKLHDGSYHFFVMEYIEGGDLYRAVMEGRVAADDGFRIVGEVGAALAFAHKRRIIHRDVKPRNILLDRTERAKLTDFDLVKAGDTTGGTRTTVGMGTFVYAAPEMMASAKDADARADVYGLAMTAIFVLLGKEVPQDILRFPDQVLARLAVSEATRGVLARAVEWKPEERTATVEALCEELREMELKEGRRRKAAEAGDEAELSLEYPQRTAELQTRIKGSLLRPLSEGHVYLIREGENLTDAPVDGDRFLLEEVPLHSESRNVFRVEVVDSEENIVAETEITIVHAPLPPKTTTAIFLRSRRGMEILFHKGTHLPAQRTVEVYRSTRRGAEEIVFPFYEGERWLANVVISDVGFRLPEGSVVELVVSIDEGYKGSASATVRATGQGAATEFEISRIAIPYSEELGW